MNKSETSWATHLEFLVLFFTLLGGYYHLDNKMDTQIMYMSERIDQVNERTDLVYSMFIDLLKERAK